MSKKLRTMTYTAATRIEVLCAAQHREGANRGSQVRPGKSMEWSHTHFDGYELLAVPSDSPASIVILDSSALVLVQRVLLPEGDAPPRALTWQPGGASTGCSSGALSCIVSTKGRRIICRGVSWCFVVWCGVVDGIC